MKQTNKQIYMDTVIYILYMAKNRTWKILASDSVSADAVSISFHFFSFCCVVPMGIFPMENLGRFPQGKPAATELCYPTLMFV